MAGKIKTKTRGGALVLVVFSIVLLLILGSGTLSLSMNGRLFSIRTARQIQASCAADAGLTKAVFEMNEKLKASSWDGSSLPKANNEPLPNCDAVMHYNVTGNINSGYAAEAIGKSGHLEKKIKATLRLQSIFDYGILAKQSIILYNNTRVDTYDSSDPYAHNEPVQVASTNTDPDCITLKSGAEVDGETYYGVDYDFPKPYPPSLPVTKTAINVKGTISSISPAQSGQYPALNLLADTKPGVLEITGGDVVLHITGDIWLGQGCEMKILPEATLTLYLDGNFISGNSAGINNETQTPESLTLYGTGQNQKFELKAKNDWYGVIYAPEADIILKAKSNLFGSFVGNSFENKSEGTIYHDVSLRKAGINDFGVRFIVDRWLEL